MNQLIAAMLADETCPNEVLRDALMEEGIDVAEVYIVTGGAGEGSDAADWEVAAFLDRVKAEELLNKLIKWARDNKVGEEDNPGWGPYPECPLDPGFRCDGLTGTSYAINEVPLKG